MVLGMSTIISPHSEPFGFSVLSRLLTSFYNLFTSRFIYRSWIAHPLMKPKVRCLPRKESRLCACTWFINNYYISRSSVITFYYRYHCFTDSDRLFHHNHLSMQHTYSTSTSHVRQYKGHLWVTDSLVSQKGKDNKDLVWSCNFCNVGKTIINHPPNHTFLYVV